VTTELTNLPLAAVDEIQYQSANNEVVAATFGRGMWVTTLPAELPAAVPEVPLVGTLLLAGAAAFGLVRRRIARSR